jgi:hypothetical protein
MEDYFGNSEKPEFLWSYIISYYGLTPQYEDK